MTFLRFLLVTGTLALLSAATPVRNQGDSVVRVPLIKRYSSIAADSSYYDAIIRRNARNLNGHRRDVRETGALSVSALLDPVKHPPAQSAKRQNVPLIDNNLRISWAGNISLGNPPQMFTVDTDTGSPWLWVPSTNCSASVCAGKDMYNSSASSSAALVQEDLSNVSYTSKWNLSGALFNDTASMGGIKISNMTFVAASNLSVPEQFEQFEQRGVDGILGLGIPVAGNQHFVLTAYYEGAVAEPIFAMNLAENSSELYIGGTNHALYNGEFEHHPVTGSKAGSWQIGNASIYMNDKEVISNISTIIDSGTSLVLGPVEQVRKLYSNLEQVVIDESTGLVVYEYNELAPTLEFTWGGKRWPIHHENFVFRSQDNMCIGAIGVSMDPSLGDLWVFGASFMRNVYTSFSFTQHEAVIGFASLNAS